MTYSTPISLSQLWSQKEGLNQEQVNALYKLMANTINIF